jgi:transposase
MARPYSRDLRDRVVAAVEGGMSCRRAAKLFNLGISTVINWVRRFRQTGSAAAKPMGGDYNSRLKGERVWLLARIEQDNDLTLEDIRAELKAERGISVGYGSVWRFYASEGISFKKKRPRGRARAA